MVYTSFSGALMFDSLFKASEPIVQDKQTRSAGSLST